MGPSTINTYYINVCPTRHPHLPMNKETTAAFRWSCWCNRSFVGGRDFGPTFWWVLFWEMDTALLADCLKSCVPQPAAGIIHFLLCQLSKHPMYWLFLPWNLVIFKNFIFEINFYFMFLDYFFWYFEVFLMWLCQKQFFKK